MAEEITKKENSWLDLIRFTLIAVSIVIPIRLWIAQPFIVSGASMEPTFDHGDYLIIDEFSYHFQKPQKDDVIVFRYPLDPKKFFIKRVIGLPGETIEVDGQTVTLAEGEYFVMGDNRSASSDSRVWGIVPEKLVIGRALLRLWPVNKAAVVLDF